MPRKSLEAWLDYIDKLHPKEIELGLDRIKPIFQKIIKSPIAKDVVVIGGTNGKGSSVEYLSELLRNSGKKVGTYTSPHIFNFNERIRINGEESPDSRIIKSFEFVEEARDSVQMTYFEFSTLAAIHLLSESNLDIVILEVGLGGRLDAVNVVEPDISILTNVQLDHQDWLGNNLEMIAKEKSAIFRKGKPAIIGERNSPISVTKEIERLEARPYKLGKDFDLDIDTIKKKWSYEFHALDKDISIPNIKLTNLSPESASVAITAFLLLGEKIDSENKKVLENTQLKARCELINNKFIVDVSHNPAAVTNLVNFIKRNFKDNIEIHAVFGVMSDKDAVGMIKSIKGLISYWYTASPRIDRAMNSSELASTLRSLTNSKIRDMKEVDKAVIEAFKHSNQSNIVLVLGSFYTVSEAYPIIKNLM